MSKKVCALIFLLSFLFMQGCASRYTTRELPLSSMFNKYNRNFIVAKPTMIGNLICGVPMTIPLVYITGWLVLPFEKSNKNQTKESVTDKIVNNVSMLPAFACGIVTGTVFIPFSYICPENPWYGSFASIGSAEYYKSECMDDPENRAWQKEKQLD